MSDHPSRRYNPSNYSSLSNAVPTNSQPNSSSGYHGGNQMYPQTSINQGPPSSQAYHQNYGTQAYGGGQPGYGYGPAAPQYPSTPYNSGSAPHYPNTTANYPAYQQPSYSSAMSPYSHPGFAAAPSPYAGQYSVDPDTSIKQCYNCGTMNTPLWRRDQATQRTLCNACGLYQAQRGEPRPQALIDADNEEDDEQPVVGGDGPQCSHCGTRKTSVWRRNKDGEQVCNACGVYYRHNGRERPLTMKQSKVKPRAKHTPI
ncbi:GATA zinc finger domain-containing protein [Mycena venus]|uniref:GATA zinc finger domain-containing protein n=1 Tax=Mycena venus TaxID=2733690 RepID=A0A8H6YN36_9AGAR|nr:GATA zinc finger domain-containing protein [Mycena venus]